MFNMQVTIFWALLLGNFSLFYLNDQIVCKKLFSHLVTLFNNNKDERRESGLEMSINPYCPPVWPDLAKFHHFGKYFKIFCNKFKVYLVLGKCFNSLWHNLFAFGQIFIAVNGQMLRTQSGLLVTLLSSLTHPVRPRNPPLHPREAKALHRLDRVKQRTLSYFIRGSMNVCLTSWSWFKLLCL